MLSIRRAQRAREGAAGAWKGIVAKRRAVRRARPETNSDLNHASRHVTSSLEQGAGRDTGGRAPAAPSVGPPVL